MKIALYKIEDSYISELHKLDDKVLYNKDNKRPYIGVIVIISEHHYYIPLGSVKYNNDNKIKKLNTQITINLPDKMGYIKFNNMIPVPLEKAKKVIIKEEEDKAYRRLLENQYEYIKNYQAKIEKKANKVRVLDEKTKIHHLLVDFEKLEKHCEEYNSNQKEDENYDSNDCEMEM